MTSANRLTEERAESDAVVAIVGTRVVRELPTDLYIPPDALEVFLETFEGPLDLLLYLIRRQNLDILEISVHEIAEQYIGYIELMGALKLELAAEYLVMAAMLAEIKSRLLLPRPTETVDEDDPRAELVRRLQEYEQFKTAAENLDALPREERDIRVAHATRPLIVRERVEPLVDLREMMIALADVLRRAELNERHVVQLEPLSVRERMSGLLERLADTSTFLEFSTLFDATEGRRGVVVTLLAILELMRDELISVVQSRAFAPIHVMVTPATSP